MMWLDIIALIVICGFALAGASSGGTRQLFRLGSAVAAVVCSPWAARSVAGPLAATFPELPMIAITGISVILSAIAIYLLLAILSRLITDVIIESSTILTVADQVFGFALGLVTAAILLWMVGHALLAIAPSLPNIEMDDSRYLALVQSLPLRDLLQLAQVETHLL